MSLRSLRAGVFGLVAVAAPGCLTSEDPDIVLSEEIGDVEQQIKGGYDDTTSTATVGIVNINQGGLCSGSLLLPNMVLTARHCVSNTLNEAPGGGVICGQTTSSNPFDAAGFYVTTRPSFTQNPDDYHAVLEVVKLPTDSSFCGQDQAILILAENIAPEEAVPYVPRVDSTLVPDEQYYAIGYGATSDSGGGAGTRRRRDELFVECAEDSCQGVGQYVKESEWIGDTGICSGDSGGPALDLQNRVVGVTSRGGPDCSSPIYGSVHSWGEWIKSTGVYAASLGGYEAPDWVNGWPTDPGFNFPIGGACGSCPVCVNNECSRFCNESAPCPDTHECVAIESGQQVCEAKPQPKPKPKAEDDGGGEDAGCSAGGRGDPTNPVPWFTGIGALGILVMLRRGRDKGSRG